MEETVFQQIARYVDYGNMMLFALCLMTAWMAFVQFLTLVAVVWPRKQATTPPYQLSPEQVKCVKKRQAKQAENREPDQPTEYPVAVEAALAKKALR